MQNVDLLLRLAIDALSKGRVQYAETLIRAVRLILTAQ